MEFSSNAIKILEKRYLVRDEENNTYEMIAKVCKLISNQSSPYVYGDDIDFEEYIMEKYFHEFLEDKKSLYVVYTISEYSKVETLKVSQSKFKVKIKAALKKLIKKTKEGLVFILRTSAIELIKEVIKQAITNPQVKELVLTP
jgi:hypothetical protein